MSDYELEIPMIDARMMDQIIEDEWANSDPFNKSWDDLKDLEYEIILF